MNKEYQKPEIKYVSLLAKEAIATDVLEMEGETIPGIDMGDVSSPF